jgi:hypothetical protein
VRHPKARVHRLTAIRASGHKGTACTGTHRLNEMDSVMLADRWCGVVFESVDHANGECFVNHAGHFFFGSCQAAQRSWRTSSRYSGHLGSHTCLDYSADLHHVDEAARLEALTRLNKLLGGRNEPVLWSTLVVRRPFQDLHRDVLPGGANETRTRDPLLANADKGRITT